MRLVERAVRRDLRQLDEVARGSGLAAAAIALARQIDETESASGAAAAARQLQALYAELLAVHERRRPAPPPEPAAPVVDEVDQIRRRRAGDAG